MDAAALSRVRDIFSKQPIYRNGLDAPPKVFFSITDFMTPLPSQTITDIAHAITLMYNFQQADLLVSIADRSSGAICHEVARLTGLPYSLANWYPPGSPGEVEVEKCAGFSGTGHIYVNGVRKGKRVAVVMDILKTGRTAGNLVDALLRAGCTVVACAFAAEIVDAGGRQFEHLVAWGGVIVAAVSVLIRGERTKDESSSSLVISGSSDNADPSAEVCVSTSNPYRLLNPASATIRRIKRLSPDDVQAMCDEVQRGFVGVPIIVNPKLAYPYSFFQLTDFVPVMTADVVETMADLCVYFADFERCDVIVSEADRGGAPLAQAVARRTNKPFVLANWYPLGDGIGAVSKASVGFSGDGQIVVNGISPGDRVIFVDDMLSSGGTAEGVLKSVLQLGGVPLEGVFVSEKLYPAAAANRLPQRKGKERLAKGFPELIVTTVVQFIADGERTTLT